MKQRSKRSPPWVLWTLSAAGVCLLPAAATRAVPGVADGDEANLEETRLTLGKWIETQQIISKERNEWQQGKEILLGRLELVKGEIAALEGKIAEARTDVDEAELKRNELTAQKEQLVAVGASLGAEVAGFEGEVRRLLGSVPEPVQAKLDPLVQRLPEDPASTRASVAERFQNVLGILNELNTANNEIAVNYEVRTLGDGKPSEVRALYIGLAQAYYVSANGEAGIGRPSADGWKWEPSQAVAGDVLVALDILQGKHTPEFVPLPVRLQ